MQNAIASSRLFFKKIKAGALPIHLKGSKFFKDTEILQKTYTIQTHCQKTKTPQVSDRPPFSG